MVLSEISQNVFWLIAMKFVHQICRNISPKLYMAHGFSFKNKFLQTNNIPSLVLSLFSKISKVLGAVFLSSEGLFTSFEMSK